jgi:hypothetical protein
LIFAEGTIVGNSVVELGDVTIFDGTLTSSGSGVLLANGSATQLFSLFDQITNEGFIKIADGARVVLADKFVNEGDILIDSKSSLTFLAVADGDVELSGGGTVTLGSEPGSTNAVGSFTPVGMGPGESLTNVDNTFQGVGHIGFNEIGFVNEPFGMVLANVPGRELVLDPGNARCRRSSTAAR